MNKTSYQISPAFRSGLSLVLWPFLMVVVAMSLDSPALPSWQKVLQTIVGVAVLVYPLCFFVGLILSRLKNEHAKEKAKFWLGLPWKIIGCCFLVLLIVYIFAK